MQVKVLFKFLLYLFLLILLQSLMVIELLLFVDHHLQITKNNQPFPLDIFSDQETWLQYSLKFLATDSSQIFILLCSFMYKNFAHFRSHITIYAMTSIRENKIGTVMSNNIINRLPSIITPFSYSIAHSVRLTMLKVPNAIILQVPRASLLHFPAYLTFVART